MTLYSFQKEDGTKIDKWYPMGECPKEIICEDGQKATRIYGCVGIIWKGSLPPGAVIKRNADMRKRNEEAGKRMRERWKSCKDN